MSFSVCAFLFERGQPPRSDKLSPEAVICRVILTAGDCHCGSNEQTNYAGPKQPFHLRLLDASVSLLSGLSTFAVLPGNERLVGESSRLHSPTREDRQEKVVRSPLQCFLPAGVAWLCPGS